MVNSVTCMNIGTSLIIVLDLLCVTKLISAKINFGGSAVRPQGLVDMSPF